MKAQANTVLFDLDGTLVDNFEALHKSYVYAFEQLGQQPPSYEKVKCSVGGSSPVTMRQLIGEELAGEALPHFEQYFKENTLQGVRILPGVKALLEELSKRGTQMAVFTNKNAEGARLICDHLDITQYMDAVVGTKEVPWRKPEKEFSEHVLALLKAAPESTIMVGDSPFDIQAGKVLGMEAYVVGTGSHSEEELAESDPAPDGVYANMIALAKGLWDIEISDN